MNAYSNFDEAVRFFDALWPIAPSGGAVLSIVNLPGGASRRFHPSELGDAAKWAAAQAGEQVDVYVGMGLIDADAPGRGEARHVRRIPGAWADIDLAGPGHKSANLPTLEEALAELDAFKLPPTMLVHSGGGLHAYWLGVGVWSAEAGDVVTGIQAALRGHWAARGWDLDNTADLARILRVPGTLNYKLLGEPRPVRILSLDGPRYEPGVLRQRFPAPERVRAEMPAVAAAPYTGDGYGTDDALAELALACEAVEDAAPGQSNAVLTAKAYYVGGLIPHELDERHALDALTEAAERRVTDDPRVGLRVLAQLQAGQSEPWETSGVVILDESAAGTLPDSFWTARPELEHIRQAAYSSLASPAAVLNYVLARVGAYTAHYLRLPGLNGTEVGNSPLGIFAANIGPSGAGKSVADDVAEALVPAPAGVRDQMPLGSGEGIAEMLFVKVPSSQDKRRMVKHQAWHNALLVADEGQVLESLSDRRGATLPETLRTLFTGKAVGQTNASEDTNRRIGRGTYSISLTLNLQPKHGQTLLRDAGGGTPQRFSWAEARDANISKPGEAPEWPGALRWAPPLHPVGRFTGTETLDEAVRPEQRDWPVQLMEVDPDIRTELQWALYAKMTSQIEVPELDSHLGLVRLKVAGCLALLNGRQNVDLDDWQLAGAWIGYSCAVRDALAAEVRREASQREVAATQVQVRRAVAVEQAKAAIPVADLARKLAEKVKASGGGVRYDTLRSSLSKKQREMFADAIDAALSEGWITEREAAGQGTAKRLLLPAEAA
jgi:hypothetical protein